MAIASVVNVPTKRNSSGSYQKLSGNRLNDGRLKDPPRFVASQIVPTTNSDIVTRVTKQKSASGLACKSLSGAVREYPVQTARTIAPTFRNGQMCFIARRSPSNETQDQRPRAVARRLQSTGRWQTLTKWNAVRLAVRCIAGLGVFIGVRNASIDNCIEVNALLEVVMSE